MPKYLFIAANEAPWGGSEVLWSKSAEKLVLRGVDVSASVPEFASTAEGVKRLREAGSQIHSRQPFSLGARFARKLIPFWNYAKEHVRSIGKGVDLVVISQGSAVDGLPWLEAARAADLKYVIIVQGASTTLWPDDATSERLAVAFENATRAYFVSQATQDLCRRQFGAALRHGHVVRNPFNVHYDARMNWPPQTSDRLSLACVGRLEVVSKGQDLLIEVLSLPRWRERSIHISLVGKGHHERALRRLVEQSKLLNVEFVGHILDVEGLWKQHHGLILPSRFEGMPLVVVEAMLCGRPCIATDVGGTSELIRDGINGFLTAAPTVELLDEAMDRAWENRGRLREMGERAAIDVRRWVSADPAEDFASELLSLTGKTGRLA
jgi:glycosyltransferase involved in cell wall biosynthesis